MDKIIMQEMSFYAYHGVLPQEQDLGQMFLVDVELGLDLRPAGISDDPGKTISYADVYEVVRQVVTGHPYKLIEALAERIADRILEGFMLVGLLEVMVRVKKPAAPIAGHFGYMAVEIRRQPPARAGE